MKVVLADQTEVEVVRVNVNYSFENNEYQLSIETEEDITMKQVKKAFTQENCSTITVKRNRKADKVFEGFLITGISQSIFEGSFGNTGVTVSLTKADDDTDEEEG